MKHEKIWSIFDRRASVRNFSNRAIDDATVDLLIQCAVTAPSNGNMQPWEFIVIRSPNIKDQIVDCTFLGYQSKGGNKQNWIKDAPVVIIACANQKRTRARYGEMGNIGSIIDVAAAIQNLLIAAANLKLACCWVGGFDEGMLKAYLKIPPNVKPIGVLPIGYSTEKPVRKNRLKIDLITHIETYHSKNRKEDTENAN